MNRERLRKWAVEAKMALAEAQKLCFDAKANLTNVKADEIQIITLDARSGYLAAEYETQLQVLSEIQMTFRAILLEMQQDFELCLRKSDIAETDLSHRMSILRSTPVDAGFGSECKYLIDFVDESSIERLRASIMQFVELIPRSFISFSEKYQAFSKSITNLRSTRIQPFADSKAIPSSEEFHEKNIESPIDIEDHIDAAAYILESLANHYDQCLSALDDLDLSKKEFEEVLNLLENDHVHAKGALFELQGRINEINTVGEITRSRLKNYRLYNEKIVTAFNIITRFGKTDLSEMVNECDELCAQFIEHFNKLKNLQIELQGLEIHYAKFSDAYDSIILEVGQRKSVEARIDSILREALHKVDTILGNERKRRLAFVEEYGKFIPSNLWPGLLNPPNKYEFVQESSPLPKLSDHQLKNAFQDLD